MMLGKRARVPMKRTTSMTEFSFDDLSILQLAPPSDQVDPDGHVGAPSDHSQSQMVMGLVSPRVVLNRRNSADFTLRPSSPSFLRTCSLCNRRLAPGRDIFMYRGDTAFCSSECRQQQMTKDEWKEKCSAVSSTNKESKSSSSHPSTAGSTVPSAKGETGVSL